jgi:hypothetical protein
MPTLLLPGGPGGQRRAPASRRGKNAPPAAERWRTFIFLASSTSFALWRAYDAFLPTFADRAARRARGHCAPMPPGETCSSRTRVCDSDSKPCGSDRSQSPDRARRLRGSARLSAIESHIVAATAVARPERHAVDDAIAARSGHCNGLRERHSPEFERAMANRHQPLTT